MPGRDLNARNFAWRYLCFGQFESEKSRTPGHRNEFLYQHVKSAFIDSVTSTFCLAQMALPGHLGSIIQIILLFFIPYIHYTMIILDVLHFSDNRTKYLRNDQVS
jgi:hypothetical protein